MSGNKTISSNFTAIPVITSPEVVSSSYSAHPSFSASYSGTYPGSVSFLVDSGVTLCDKTSQYEVDPANPSSTSHALPVYGTDTFTGTSTQTACNGYHTPLTMFNNGTYVASLYRTTSQGRFLVATTSYTVSGSTIGDGYLLSFSPSSSGRIISLTSTFFPSNNLTNTTRSIDCGSVCQTKASAGSVTVEAFPNRGYVFSGWTGACAGASGDTCTVTFDASKNISAIYNATAIQDSSYTNTPSFRARYDGKGFGAIEFMIDEAVTSCEKNNLYSVDTGNGNSSLNVRPWTFYSPSNGKVDCNGYYADATYLYNGTYTAKLYKNVGGSNIQVAATTVVANKGYASTTP
jgi:uncharacterized repeat protein (TIGR02543 family)